MNTVLLEKRDGYAIVTLNRPEQMNALSRELRRDFVAVFGDICADASIRVVILTGAGAAFCAGFDLKELGSGNSENAAEEVGNELAEAMEAFDGPIIGAINGHAVTGGFEMALACDVLIASENARFADTHARVGILAGWGLSQKLPRMIGLSRAKEISFTGAPVFARQACEWGLVNHVVPAGALTRRNRLIVDAPAEIRGLAIGRDHVVFLADGVAGVAPRGGDVRTTWMPTDVAAPGPVHTHRAGGAIVLLALTPSLERWILHPDRRIVEREVLDPTARHFAHLRDGGADGAPRRVWTTGDETIGSHDLVGSRHSHHRLMPRQPGDFVVVPDMARPDDIDRGWFVGLVHDPSTTSTDLRVSDAAHIAEAIATIHLPHRIPRGLRCTWVPATPATTTQHTPSPRTDGS